MATVSLPPALTTTFSPAASCTDNIYWYTYFSLGPPDTSDCFPPAWASTTGAFFSPGVCPHGYSNACPSTITAGAVTETRGTCCPNGYTCFTETAGKFEGEACSSHVITSGNVTVTVSTVIGFVPKVTTVTPGDGVNAFGVAIRYQSSDFATSTSSSTSLTSSQTSSAPSAVNTTETDGDGGLSAGAKAGIGAGIAVVCLIAVATGIGFLMRRSRRKREAVTRYSASMVQEGHDGMRNEQQKRISFELNSPPAKMNLLPTEMNSPLAEMNSPPAEISSAPVELPDRDGR